MSQAHRTWAPRAGRKRQPAADRHRGAEPVSALGGCDTYRSVPSRRYNWALSPLSSRTHARTGAAATMKWIRSCCRKFAHSRPEHESPVTVPVEQFMDLEGDRQAMRRGPRQSGLLDQVAERARAGGYGIENGHRFVDDADAATMSHKAILASQYTRRQAQKGGACGG